MLTWEKYLETALKHSEVQILHNKMLCIFYSPSAVTWWWKNLYLPQSEKSSLPLTEWKKIFHHIITEDWISVLPLTDSINCYLFISSVECQKREMAIKTPTRYIYIYIYIYSLSLSFWLIIKNHTTDS